jgi:L-aspartate oxidase
MGLGKNDLSTTKLSSESLALIIGAGLARLTVTLHMAESQPVILMANRGLSNCRHSKLLPQSINLCAARD